MCSFVPAGSDEPLDHVRQSRLVTSLPIGRHSIKKRSRTRICHAKRWPTKTSSLGISLQISNFNFGIPLSSFNFQLRTSLSVFHLAFTSTLLLRPLRLSQYPYAADSHSLSMKRKNDGPGDTRHSEFYKAVEVEKEIYRVCMIFPYTVPFRSIRQSRVMAMLARDF
jgi:hypothetical protein